MNELKSQSKEYLFSCELENFGTQLEEELTGTANVLPADLLDRPIKLVEDISYSSHWPQPGDLKGKPKERLSHLRRLQKDCNQFYLPGKYIYILDDYISPLTVFTLLSIAKNTENILAVISSITCICSARSHFNESEPQFPVLNSLHNKVKWDPAELKAYSWDPHLKDMVKLSGECEEIEEQERRRIKEYLSLSDILGLGDEIVLKPRKQASKAEKAEIAAKMNYYEGLYVNKPLIDVWLKIGEFPIRRFHDIRYEWGSKDCSHCR